MPEQAQHKEQVNHEGHQGSTAKAKDAPDEGNLKAVSAVAYLGILFFIPMVTNPKSKFAMFHANQGLLLLIAAVAVNLVGAVVPFLGWFIIWPLGSIFVFVLFIMGLVNALNGRMKRLPLIGGFDLIKAGQ